MPNPPAKPYRFSAPSTAASRAAAEKAARRRKLQFALYAFAAIAALVFASSFTPPAGNVHSFTNASDYKASKESGCTNSGDGCHGKESAYTDFNAYHPNSECTSCHDYDGVGCLPCHSPKNHECPICHDGTMKQAPDRVRITDPYPRGHYRETTHTAMGTDFAQSVPAVAGGKASATCKNCHARDLMGSHLGVPIVAGSEYGDSVGCGDCHNDVRSKGLAEVKSDWKKRECESCHRLGSSTPMHAVKAAGAAKGTSPRKCGETGSGCHTTSDLHLVHPDAPKQCSGSAAKGEPGCHDLELQAHKPTAKSCGGGSKTCHAPYVNDDYSHKRDREAHSPEGTAPASDSSFYDTPCGDCHWMAPDGTSLVTEHAMATSQGSSDNCRGCHSHKASTEAVAEGWPGRDGTRACSACHGKAGLGSAHERELAPLHVAENSSGCAETGDGCHVATDLLGVGKNGLHDDCVTCHDPTAGNGNVSYDPDAKSCGTARACHDAYSPATSVHNGSGGLTDGADPAHRATMLAAASIEDSVTGLIISCTECHSDRLGTEHARPNNSISRGAGTVCIRCHDASVLTSSIVIGDWPRRTQEDACFECHDAMDSGVTHLRRETGHEGRELDLTGALAPGACVAAGCHPTAELRYLHIREGCTVAGCHKASGDIFGTGSTGCGGPAGGKACHAGYSGLTGHAENALSHGGIELDLLGNPTSGFCVRPGCHQTINLKTLHGTGGCINDGCHKPGSVIGVVSCGGTNAAVACHTGFTSAEHFVDHSADISGTVNGITYVDGDSRGCFGCHNKDLAVEHTATATAGVTGGGATSCAVCHYHSGDPGNGAYAGLPNIMGAVTSNDFRCSACHKSGSASPGSGYAASAHKRTTTSATEVPGYVWTDPAQDWAAAFAAATGGGHNVSAFAGRRFPVTSYVDGATTYAWTLPPNSGFTRWLDSTAFGGAAVGTEAQIAAVTVTCSDCHSLSPAMEGPHGAAVPIAIDPAYSQTEYANPTRGLESQFGASGTRRVVCMKCHSLEFGSVPGTSTPGGNIVHAQHARHYGPPTTSPKYYGEKCIDCHARIPHAWRSPRLLVRTVAEPGRPADAYPYVAAGHQGLAGVLLRDIDGGAPWSAGWCITGGCHGYSNPSDHPTPSEVPTAKYWP